MQHIDSIYQPDHRFTNTQWLLMGVWIECPTLLVLYATIRKSELSRADHVGCCCFKIINGL